MQERNYKKLSIKDIKMLDIFEDTDVISKGYDLRVINIKNHERKIIHAFVFSNKEKALAVYDKYIESYKNTDNIEIIIIDIETGYLYRKYKSEDRI